MRAWLEGLGRRLVGAAPIAVHVRGAAPESCSHRGCRIETTCRFYDGRAWLPFCSEHVLDAIGGRS